MKKFLKVACLVVVAAPIALWAGETKHLRLKSRQEFASGALKLENVVVTAKGELRVGLEAEVRALPGEATVWCGAAFGGTIYAGTSTGKIYAVQASGEPRVAFETGQLLVTSLAATKEHLYAGTIPEGRIYRMDASGRWEDFRRVPAKYVWQLASIKGEIYAACGLPGIVVRVTGGDQPQTVGEVGAEHALSIAHDGKNLAAGTAMPGRLVRFEAAGPKVVHDFRDLEVRALALRADGLWAAVNSAPRNPDQIIALSRSTQGEPQALPGDGKPATALWRFSASAAEEIVRMPDVLINAMAPTSDGVLVAVNNGGRVFRVRGDRSSELELDLPAKQAMDLVVDAGGRVAAVTLGDRGFVARLTGKPATSGTFLSNVYDTAFPSHWGLIKAAGTGKFSLRFRSGVVDDTREAGWTAWSEPIRAFPAPIPVATGRYLQFKVALEEAAAVVRELEVSYRNQNQPPRILDLKMQEIQMMIPPDNPPQKPEIVRRPLDIHTPYREIQWQAADTDGDTLSFRVYARAENSNQWLPLLGGEATSGVGARWDTQTVPDGRYLLKVVVTDAPSNLAGEALEATKESEPFVVDNGKPSLVLKALGGGRFRAEAKDDWSRIARFEFRVGGGEWNALACKDGLFDSKAEETEFGVDLPRLSVGPHLLMVRAVDALSNVALASESFEVK
ncbi:MAG TPA: hypothetical protein VI643_04190 [Planctomycetota bacterium]|nr:hypothetical protein [Planctomycetota bacterium]